MDAGRPTVNFAISTRGREPGLDHLGIQVENSDELQEVHSRLRKAGGNIIEQGETACCYAKSEKSWIGDPAGISWETFHTKGVVIRTRIRKTSSTNSAVPLVLKRLWNRLEEAVTIVNELRDTNDA
jgi:hypothetical protein